jgi:geranylgeranyl diphosphate synthase type I
LSEGLGDPDLDEAGVGRLREIITATGALDRTEERIAELTRSALEALGTVALDPEGVEVLTRLAAAATRRLT